MHGTSCFLNLKVSYCYEHMLQEIGVEILGIIEGEGHYLQEMGEEILGIIEGEGCCLFIFGR